MRPKPLWMVLVFACGCAQGSSFSLDDSELPSVVSDAGSGVSGRDAANTPGPVPDPGPSDAKVPAEVDATTPPDPPAECAKDGDCPDDANACNGKAICVAGRCEVEPHPGCDDGQACTQDECVDPQGTCTHTAPDVDQDGYLLAGCLGGDDCADTDALRNPDVSEVCDGIDNDCSGKADDAASFACALGSEPVSCALAGGGTGVAACTQTCQRGGCQLPNDSCENALTLASGTSLSGSLSGSVRDTAGDCGVGGDVFYTLTISQPSLVYLDTLGSSANTALSYRGTSCPGTTVVCEDDACGGTQSQLVQKLDAGRHVFAVHSAGSTADQGFILRTQVIAAAGGQNVRTQNLGSFTGNTGAQSSVQAVRASCGAGAEQPEDAYYFTQCPGTSRTIRASTCSALTSFDTVLHARDVSGQLACNDNTYAGCDVADPYSVIEFAAQGAGLFVVYVDGFGFSDLRSGPYGLTLSVR